MNHQGLNDFTPLDLAMHTQCPEVERVLLDHGAKGSVCLIAQRQRLFSVVGIIMSTNEVLKNWHLLLSRYVKYKRACMTKPTTNKVLL